MDQLRFHTLDELRALSLEELHALWDLVPTDRQRAYRQAYDREVRNAGALGSDAAELQVTEELLRRYTDTALVPVGTRWARTPNRIQDAARQHESLQPPEDDAVVGRTGPSRRVTILFGVMIVLFIGLILVRLLGGSGSEVAEATSTVTPTLIPDVSPTPTPLALEDQDRVIQGGDAERVVAYPVNLQVVLPDGSTPRVWVVQRRAVRASEWPYDPNPDTASFINGMSVRPVIGIPWSADNAAWFARMAAGTIFHVTMNTGAVLRYEFAARTEVLRSETNIFRQVSPGLVLLLIGETDEDGLPTATRMLVTATYPPEQELSRGDLLAAVPAEAVYTPVPTATSLPARERLHVDVITVTTAAGRLTTRLRVYNDGMRAVRITPDDIWLALGYAPDPPGPRQPAEGLTPFDLLPEQAVDLTLVWYWASEPYGALQVGEWRFAMQVVR